MKQQITILDIAEKCKLSKSAVAYVLNGTADGKVSKKNQNFIQATAKELGYRPNIAARRLRSNKSFTIGVLLPSPRDTIYALIVAELQHLLTGTNYHATFSFWETMSDIEKATQYIISQGTDAIITLEPHFLPDNLTIPVVSYYNEDLRFDYVGYDSYDIMDTTINYLEGMGHTKMGLASPPKAPRSINFIECIKKRSLPYNTDWYLWDTEKTKDRFLLGKKLLEKLVSCSTPPTAIVAHNDTVAIGMLQKAWELGIKIPNDLSIIGFDNIPQATYSIPPLTTFQQYESQSIAEILLKMTFERIKTPSLPKRRHIINPKLIVRQTTGKINTN